MPRCRLALDIQELPDGVRYRLPRRRRRGWVLPALGTVTAIVFYLMAPIFFAMSGLTSGSASWGILLLAVFTLFLFVSMFLVSFRELRATLLTPDTVIELHPGRLIVLRSSPGRLDREEVPLNRINRLSIQSFAEMEGPDGEAPLVEQQSSRVNALHFFGSLFLEGDTGIDVIAAETYSSSYLHQLAYDLGARINADRPEQSVQLIRPVATSVEPASDPPAECSVRCEHSPRGFLVILLPRGKRLSASELGWLAGIQMLLLGALGLLNLSLFWGSWNPGCWFCSFYLLILLLWPLATKLSRRLRERRSAKLELSPTRLHVRHMGLLWSRERAWPLDQIAACAVERQHGKDEKGHPVDSFHLIVLDHAMNRDIVLHGQPYDEVQYLAAALNSELDQAI